MNENKIDFVLPWVDPDDPHWQEQRMQYDKEFNIEDKDTRTRFRDMNTLKYVLRSIDKYCPWYNKIYLITTGHYPEWLDINHSKIELITHQELFIDKTALPVFNSNAIEMNLINIPNLSEKFIYLNDDMIIWTPLEKSRFFRNEKPVDFFSHSLIPRNKFYEFLKGKDTWVDSINNNIKLLNKNIPQQSPMKRTQLYHHSYSTKQKINNFIYQYLYKKLVWINHWHHPQAYLKTTIEETYNSYKTEMHKTAMHKFRSSNDITPYLYRYSHLMKGDFEPYTHNDGLVVKISSFKYLKKMIPKIEQSKHINFICFNDQMSNVDANEFQKTTNFLETYLENIFPDKASFENTQSKING